ncbi:RICIN domain-containing protein [Streptomyces sp. NPDC059894]|uniref:RICIN domain-containing protein n=1 Tax=unclassified Streptomyces TaxID=2593676 RepID=UPI003656B640
MSTTTTDGYASYKVGTSVTGHQACGLGVYSYCNQNQPVHADRATEAPDRTGVALHDMVSVFLAGSGGIDGSSALHAVVTPTSWGWDQQRWSTTDAGGGYYAVTNVGNPGLRLTTTSDAYPSGSGNHKIKVSSATGSDDQLWKIEKTADGYYRLIDKARGTALQSTFDVYGGSADARQLAGTSASFVNDQQSWALVPG